MNVINLYITILSLVLVSFLPPFFLFRKEKTRRIFYSLGLGCISFYIISPIIIGLISYFGRNSLDVPRDQPQVPLVVRTLSLDLDYCRCRRHEQNRGTLSRISHQRAKSCIFNLQVRSYCLVRIWTV